MGIEEIQKINTLAKELLKHHIASSSEDAYAQAELAVRGEAPKVSKEDEINKELRMIGLKMNSLYSDMYNMQQEMKSVKEELSSVKRLLLSRPAAPEQRVEPKVIQQEAAVVSQARIELQQPKTAVPITVTASVTPDQMASPEKKGDLPRSRTGDYAEKDVQVEKFFYFGNKK